MSPRLTRWLLLIALAWVIAMTGQAWVGRRLVYDAAPDKARVLHEAILADRPPPGQTWEAIGANGTNLRRVNVELAQAVHTATGLSLPDVYFGLDTVFLMATLVLLGAYLARWLEPAWVACGLLFHGTTGVMTYLFHYFHPWDRLSQLVWIAALWMVRDRRFWPLGALVVFGTLVKYDIVMVVALWAAWTWDGTDRRRWALQSAALAAVAFGTLGVLQATHSAGFDAQQSEGIQHTWLLLSRTWTELRTRGFAFPPLLMFGLPLALAWLGWSRLERFHKLSVTLAVVMLGAFLLASNFREVRAQVPVLYLLLPSALLVARRLLAPPSAESTTPLPQ